MSFVSIIANKNFCSIMSDGRVKDKFTDQIISEEYRKFELYNSETNFIACTGTRGFGEYIMNKVNPTTSNFENWIKSFEDLFNDAELQRHLSSNPDSLIQCIFGGLSDNREIELYSFDFENKSIKKQEIFDDRFKILVLGEIEYLERASEICKKELEQISDITPSNIVSIQKIVNNYVADNTSYVNKKTFRKVIKK